MCTGSINYVESSQLIYTILCLQSVLLKARCILSVVLHVLQCVISHHSFSALCNVCQDVSAPLVLYWMSCNTNASKLRSAVRSYSIQPPAASEQCCSFSAACPPTCTHDFCSKRRNRKKPCSRYINTSIAIAQHIMTNSFHFSPTSHSKSGCPNQCRSTYCNACYYSEDTRSTPQKCNRRICTDKADCLQQWAKCVDRKNRKKNKVDKQLIHNW